MTGKRKKTHNNKEFTFLNISNLQITNFNDEDLPVSFLQNKKFGIREGTFDYYDGNNSTSLILYDKKGDHNNTTKSFCRITFNYDDFKINDKPTNKKKINKMS